MMVPSLLVKTNSLMSLGKSTFDSSESLNLMSLGAGNFILPIADILGLVLAVTGIGSVTPDSTWPHPTTNKLVNSIELINRGLMLVCIGLGFQLNVIERWRVFE